MAVDGGIFIDILTRLNMSSVDRVLADVKSIMKDAGTTSGDAFTTSLDRSVAAGAKGAFDPLVEASNAAFRDMQIGMANMQTAEARINELRARNYKTTTDQMISAQGQLDAAIANTQKLMAEASRSNAAYRDSFVAAPALGDRGGTASEDRSARTPLARDAASSSRTADMATGAALMGVGDAVGTAETRNTIADRTSELTADVLGERFKTHLENGARGTLRATGLASALGLVGMTSYGVRAESRIQDNMAQLQALQGESPANVAMMTPQIWQQAIQTGYNTNDISKLYPSVERATNPVTGGRYRGNDASSVVGTSLQLARVAGIDPSEALQGLTTSMANYHVGPSGATGMANVIAQGLGGFKGSAQDYFEAQHSIEPIAEMTGISAPEIFAGLDVASQSGQSAQQSAQNFANLIKNLARPTSTTSAALQQLGLNPEDMSVNLSKNGIAGTLQPILQAITNKQYGPNGSVVLGALADKPLMQQQQGQIFDQMSPEAQKYVQSDEFQKSLVSGFSARKVLQKAGSQNFTTSDMPLMQTWLQDQQRLMGASDVLKRNQVDEENPFGAFSDAIGGKDAGRIALMLGGSPDALNAYKKRTSDLAGAQGDPNSFTDAFHKAMDTNIQQWHVLGQQLGELSGRIGDAMLPALQGLAHKFQDAMDFLDKHHAAEQALIDAMLGLAGAYVAQKLGVFKLIGGAYNLAKKVGGGGGDGGGAANAAGDSKLEAAATTLQTAAETFDEGVTTFDTGATTFDTATAAFAEAVPIFGEAVPIFGEAAPVFSEAATAFSAAVAPFETAATTMDGASSTMEAAASQLEGAATALDGAATQLDAAAGAQDLRPPGGVPVGAPGESGGVGKALGTVALPMVAADALSGHNTPALINNALHGKQENGQPLPYQAPTQSQGNTNGFNDLAKIPVSKGGFAPDVPGRAAGGMIDQSLLGLPDTGGDSYLGMLPGGQPVGLRGGEGILTPEAVQALGGEGALNKLNSNPWSNPTKVGTTFYGSFAQGVAKYSPFGKYLTATSQTLDDLEKEQENAQKAQAAGQKQDATAALGQIFGGAGNIPGLGSGKRQSGSFSPNWWVGSEGAGASKGSLDDWIAQAEAAAGVDSSWTSGLKTLIGRESGGNPNAINRWDSNAKAGHPSQGLMQTIPGTFSAYHVPGTASNITDPVANIAAGIEYIKSRYGGIGNVQQANPHMAPKGYSTGGIIPTSPAPAGPPTGPGMPAPPPSTGKGPAPGPGLPTHVNNQQSYGPFGTNNLPGMNAGIEHSANAGAHKTATSVHGAQPSNTQIPGGTAPKGDRNIKDNPSQQLQPEGKGFGVGGGLLGAAEQAGAMAANAFAPGSGQAAQGAFALANRAIGYVGQLFGIGIEGLMETFLPNDDPAADPSKNIFGKIALGIAGAHPSGQNTAGGSAKPLDPKKDLDAASAQGKQNPGIHVENIHNHSGDHQETFNAMQKAVNFGSAAGWFAGQ